MEDRLNKREMVYALFRSALGFLYMSLVFFGWFGNTQSRMEYALLVMFGTLAMVIVPLLAPENSEPAQWIFFIMDLTLVCIGFFAFNGIDGYFIYLFPLLAISAAARFGRVVSVIVVAALILIIAGSTASVIGDKVFQVSFWAAILGLVWLAYLNISAGSQESKYRVMYLDQERNNSELVDKLIRMEKKMQSQTIVDPVTGLKNFRYFRLRIDEEISRASRLKYKFSLCLMEFDEADEFKKIYGEKEWNKAMLKMAGRLREHVRDTDLLGRYNENQFLALFPQASSNQALIPVMRIKKAHEQLKLGPDGMYTPTMCYGISCFPDDVKEVGGLLSLASAALKRSQAKGNGMITIASSLYVK